MSLESAGRSPELTQFEQLRYGREVLRREGEAVLALSRQLPNEFCDAVRLILDCNGCVIVTGIGKAGHIGQKLAATLASTGTASHFLHPSEAVHGDLGRIRSGDLVLALSSSGSSEEVVRLLPTFHELQIKIIAITGDPTSRLAESATIVLSTGKPVEACSLGLAPSTSTTAMLAMGDALALVASRMKRFTRANFATYHPGGSLGRELAKVDECMRPLQECRLAVCSATVREVLVEVSRPGRRSGAIMLVDSAGKLAGIFTDSDLARILESKRDDAIDAPIQQIMTESPTTVGKDQPLNEAIAVLARRRISELPVVDESWRPIGMIDITDLVDYLPASARADSSQIRSGPEVLKHPQFDTSDRSTG